MNSALLRVEGVVVPDWPPPLPLSVPDVTDIARAVELWIVQMGLDDRVAYCSRIDAGKMFDLERTVGHWTRKRLRERGKQAAA